eukprot:16451527-Heterocapsa_arctica.AAC.1
MLTVARAGPEHALFPNVCNVRAELRWAPKRAFQEGNKGTRICDGLGAFRSTRDTAIRSNARESISTGP